MSKTSEFRKYIDRSAHLWLSVAAFFVCMLSYVPLAAAQGAHVTAMGQQTMERFLCDLPYVVSLPVTLLLAAILAVCAVRGKGQRPLVYYVVVFLLVFMLWMVSSSQLLAAKLAGTVALYRVANFFLYLVPAAANLVVLGARGRFCLCRFRCAGDRRGSLWRFWRIAAPADVLRAAAGS